MSTQTQVKPLGHVVPKDHPSIASLIWNLIISDFGTHESWNTEAQATCIHCGGPCTAVRALVEYCELKNLPAKVGTCSFCHEAWSNDQRKVYMEAAWGMLTKGKAALRETDASHPGWNHRAWKTVEHLDPHQSYYFFGESGSCKTRAMTMVLRQFIARGYTVSIMWPWDLKEFKGFIKDRRDKIQRWVDPSILGIDDGLINACQHESLTDTLLDLIDMRMMAKRPMIYTSQINLDSFLESAKSARGGNDLSDAALKRMEAIVRRIREQVLVKPFTFDTVTYNVAEEATPF